MIYSIIGSFSLCGAVDYKFSVSVAQRFNTFIESSLVGVTCNTVVDCNPRDTPLNVGAGEEKQRYIGEEQKH